MKFIPHFSVFGANIGFFCETTKFLEEFFRLPCPPLAKRALKKMPIFGKTNENVVSFYTCEQFSDIQIPSLF